MLVNNPFCKKKTAENIFQPPRADLMNHPTCMSITSKQIDTGPRECHKSPFRCLPGCWWSSKASVVGSLTAPPPEIGSCLSPTTVMEATPHIEMLFTHGQVGDRLKTIPMTASTAVAQMVANGQKFTFQAGTLWGLR